MHYQHRQGVALAHVKAFVQSPVVSLPHARLRTALTSREHLILIVDSNRNGIERSALTKGFPFTDAKFTNRTLFPLTYGNTCKAWEKDYCADMWPGTNDPGGWCCEDWCYVNASCPTAVPSWQNASAEAMWW